MKPNPPLSITGLGCLSSLGHDPQAHVDALSSPAKGFERLGTLVDLPDPLASVPAAWIKPRRLLSHRKWSPATCATLHVARQAMAEAGWSESERESAGIVFGTSRGTAAGWLEPWPDRRPFSVMAASNSLASEPAAAVGHELGLGGNWHVVGNGCCAGLDALGTAALWIHAGLAERVLVIACDLPLVRPILEAYQATGILAGPGREGMTPGEGAAALCLEAGSRGQAPSLRIYSSAGEPTATLGAAREFPGLRRLLTGMLDDHPQPTLCLPHSSGTPAHSRSENIILSDLLDPSVPCLSLKPYTGHCVGASGLLETVIACQALRDQQALSGTNLPIGASILKIASAMGGKHSAAIIDSPHE